MNVPRILGQVSPFGHLSVFGRMQTITNLTVSRGAWGSTKEVCDGTASIFPLLQSQASAVHQLLEKYTILPGLQHDQHGSLQWSETVIIKVWSCMVMASDIISPRCAYDPNLLIIIISWEAKQNSKTKLELSWRCWRFSLSPAHHEKTWLGTMVSHLSSLKGLPPALAALGSK